MGVGCAKKKKFEELIKYSEKSLSKKIQKKKDSN